jgi:hypothetical protein
MNASHRTLLVAGLTSGAATLLYLLYQRRPPPVLDDAGEAEKAKTLEAAEK